MPDLRETTENARLRQHEPQSGVEVATKGVPTSAYMRASKQNGRSVVRIIRRSRPEQGGRIIIRLSMFRSSKHESKLGKIYTKSIFLIVYPGVSGPGPTSYLASRSEGGRSDRVVGRAGRGNISHANCFFLPACRPKEEISGVSKSHA